MSDALPLVGHLAYHAGGIGALLEQAGWEKVMSEVMDADYGDEAAVIVEFRREIDGKLTRVIIDVTCNAGSDMAKRVTAGLGEVGPQ